MEGAKAQREVGFYATSRLCLGSEIELSGMVPMEPTTATPDIRFRVGDVPERLADDAISGPTWQIDRQRFLFRIPSVAHLLISEGRDVRVAPQESTPLAEIAIFLSSTVLGIRFSRNLPHSEPSASRRPDRRRGR